MQLPKTVDQMAAITRLTTAPISVRERGLLTTQAHNLRRTAADKGLSLDAFEEYHALVASRGHFETGCWLFYYGHIVRQVPGPLNLVARVDCLRRFFASGVKADAFYTVFDFGQRQIDSMFEQGDGQAVIDGLRAWLPRDSNGNLSREFKRNGWALAMPAFALA